MNKDKEPLLSATEFYDAIIDMSNIPREHWQNEIIDFMDNYARYKTEWHKNNEKWYSDEDMDKAYNKGFKDAMIKYRE